MNLRTHVLETKDKLKAMAKLQALSPRRNDDLSDTTEIESLYSNTNTGLLSTPRFCTPSKEDSLHENITPRSVLEDDARSLKKSKRPGRRERERMRQERDSQTAAARRKQEAVAAFNNQLKKTKLCTYFFEQGGCQLGDRCGFAHGVHELNQAPDLQKTRLCEAFIAGDCEKMFNCSFAHGEEELRADSGHYKRSLCSWHEQGRCRNGAACRFAHGAAELRPGLQASTPPRLPPPVPRPPPGLEGTGCAGQEEELLFVQGAILGELAEMVAWHAKVQVSVEDDREDLGVSIRHLEGKIAALSAKFDRIECQLAQEMVQEPMESTPLAHATLASPPAKAMDGLLRVRAAERSMLVGTVTKATADWQHLL